MKNNTKLKIILIIFFIILFGFLFWFLYKPSGSNIKETPNNEGESLFNWLLGGEKISPEKKEKHNTTKKESEYEWEMDFSRLRQISKIPVAGVYMGPLSVKEIHSKNVENNVYNTKHAWKVSDNISEIRYVAQKNGYVYSSYTNSLKTKQISNTIIPKVYRADFWDKNHFILQYLDSDNLNSNIRTYSVLLQGKSLDELLIERVLTQDKKIKINEDMMKFNGYFLPVNIEDYSLYNKKEIFYLLKDDKGGVKGYTSTNTGADKKEIFRSQLKEWNLQWKNGNYILMNTKPTFANRSIFFSLNSYNGKFKKIMKSIKAGDGLPNNDFTKIAISGKNYDDEYKLWIYDNFKKEYKEINLGTFVEKCVWSKDSTTLYCAVPEYNLHGQMPDVWYRGYVDFTDYIYEINTESGETKVIYSPYDYSNGLFDIVNMKIDYYENYLYFIDSKTNFAWSYKLDKKNNIKTIDNSNTTHKVLGGGKLCPQEQLLSENLKSGNRNGVYSSWAKKKITEVKILQEHMNRLGFSAGDVDGILGSKSDSAIKRMQKYLGTYQDGKVGPITRGLINHSCH